MEDYLESPFEALFKSVNVLFADDEPRQLQFYRDMVGEHPLYNVLTASSARQAREILLADTPVHLCVLDLGIDDIDRDEFFLLKKFGNNIPFIIISGSMDMERAFAASQIGAAGMVAKPPEVTMLKFWETLSCAFCNKSIIPMLPENANPQLRSCCEAICRSVPDSVSEWASKVNITDTYLRKLWNDCFTFSPKYMLALYRMYYFAFRYHDALYLSELNNKNEPPLLTNSELEEYRHQIKYYLQNKGECDGIRDRTN